MARQTLYDGAINNTDAKAVFKAIADGGWATDSSYQVSLSKMYDQYGEQLKWLDEKAISKYGKTPFKKRFGC